MSLSFYIPDSHSGNDEYTSMLLHGDESPLVDSSSYDQTLTIHGGTARSASESIFGGYSAYFTNTSAYLSIDSPGSEFDFGTQDMTLDFWVKHNGANLWTFFYTCNGGNIYLFHPDSTWTGGLGAPNGALQCYFGTPGAGQKLWSDDGTWRGSTAWHHLAIVQYNRTAMMFIDGVKQSKTADLSSYVPAAPTKVFLAAELPGDTGYGMGNGYMDEVRLSVGIARWTENFTPPDAPYF